MITLNDILLLSPEISLVIGAFVVIIADLFSSKKNISAIFTIIFLAISSILSLALTSNLISFNDTSGSSIINVLSIDKYSLFLKSLILISGLSISLCGLNLLSKELKSKGEFWALFLISITGMTLLTSTAEMITAWVALELTSLPVIGMLALNQKKYSLEVALKYLILSATSSAIILMGIAYIYGVSGSTFFSEISTIETALTGKFFFKEPSNILMLFGVLLLISGASFKIASFPFFSWVPDVYQGAPTIVTIYLSVVSKIAGFSIIIRILFDSINSSMINEWALYLSIMAAISMTFGNIMALRQINIKRLFAYSTIAHAGYILIGLASSEPESLKSSNFAGIQSSVFYIAAYAITNLTAFLSILSISKEVNSYSIEKYKGIGIKLKFQSIILAIALISLLGIPATIGFMGKAFIFSSAISNNLMWLALLGILNSVISAYYYIRIIKLMFIDTSEDQDQKSYSSDLNTKIVTSFGTVLILILGLAPAMLLGIVEDVVNILQ
ncbi:MAG: NADH-quinone oxidoreductase subunit N [Chloroflexota bacterium]|nr:NADH-quinone oxidoreductase subunit N [Chloroflexota bacterium]